jgi:RNA recognition motif-containing protein
MRYGFVVYKNREDAEKAIGDQFVKIQSELFDKPLEVKIEKSVNSNSTQQRRNRYKDQ